MDFEKIKRRLKSMIINIPIVQKKRNKYLNKIRADYNFSSEPPTIICSSCIGGMISHNLGLRFMSPTINLWMSSKDLVKFVTNLDEYLNGEFVEVKHSGYNYPVGKLNDIQIYFNHYSSLDEAMIKWNERKTRINRENMFIITDDKGLDANDIQLLKKVTSKRTIVFSKDKNDDFFFKFKSYQNADEIGLYSVRGLGGFAVFEKEFNYALWFNGRDNYRM